jgi:hypothetical protein
MSQCRPRRRVNAVYVRIDTIEQALRDLCAIDVPGLQQPTWQDVEGREYHAWSVDRIVVDTANKNEGASVAELLQQLARVGATPT